MVFTSGIQNRKYSPFLQNEILISVVITQNEKKKREFTDLIVSGVAQDWVKGLLKDKEGKVYNPGVSNLRFSHFLDA